MEILNNISLLYYTLKKQYVFNNTIYSIIFHFVLNFVKIDVLLMTEGTQ